MSARLTLDASVWLASLSPSEAAHDVSRRVLERVLDGGMLLQQPGLFVVEVSATIARRTRDPALAMAAARAVLACPGVVLRELDHATAAAATMIAAECGLRGADAVYVATAQRCGATLVTLDEEMRARSAPVLAALSPAEWLAR